MVLVSSVLEPCSPEGAEIPVPADIVPIAAALAIKKSLLFMLMAISFPYVIRPWILCVQKRLRQVLWATSQSREYPSSQHHETCACDQRLETTRRKDDCCVPGMRELQGETLLQMPSRSGAEITIDHCRMVIYAQQPETTSFFDSKRLRPAAGRKRLNFKPAAPLGWKDSAK